jgi:hypothetical protein
MTQHINLLFRKKSLAGPAVRQLLAPLLAVALVPLILWVWRQSDEAGARESERAAIQQLQQIRSSLATSSTQTVVNLDKEIETLKPRALAAQMMLGKLDALGRQHGYSSYFTTLAGISENGLWLNRIEISMAGKLVSISGRALDKAAVLRYAKKLNARFADLGVQFSSLDVTPESVQGKAGDTASTLNVVSFRLN